MTKWFRDHRTEILTILIILLIASFFRFYRLPEYMTFLGDEGRDAIIVKKILVEHDLPFIGPPTSVGNIYLGPLYYYMMAVPMAIFWLNPVAAAGMAASIGVVTVFLIFILSKKWFGLLPGASAAFLYAVSPVNIIYSRSSWNPNPAPFFALLAVVGLDKARSSRDFRWLILSGAAIASALQMHYLALILLPVFIILWAHELENRKKYKFFTLGTLGAILAFFFLMLPLVLFDLRHNFLNVRAITFLFSQGSAVEINIFENLARVFSIYSEKLIGRYLAGSNVLLTFLISIIVFLPTGLALILRYQRKKIGWPFFVLSVWLIIGLIGLSFYRSSIFDHYLGFLNPVPYLLLAGFLSFLKGKKQKLTVFLIIIIVGAANLVKNPLLNPPNYQLQRTQEIARFIINKSNSQPFNFALIAQNNYDAAYQYYLDIYGVKPKILPFEKTNQLFVVCEDAVCHPVGHPKHEIAAFGWTLIDEVFDVLGVKVYRLIHNPAGNSS